MIITLLRKPLEGSVAENTLKHGCGAINIDATRVGVGHHLPLGKLTSKRLSEDGGLGAGSGREGEREVFTPRSAEGRWPANFILTHLEGCGLNGKETVANWDCVEGCPVKELDQQSGNRKTTWVSASHKNNRQGDFLGALGHPKDQGYNDEGGASRFFKQFKGS